MMLLNEKLALEDGGYGSGSESLSILIPLCRVLCLYHILAGDTLLFIPAIL